MQDFRGCIVFSSNLPSFVLPNSYYDIKGAIYCTTINECGQKLSVSFCIPMAHISLLLIVKRHPIVLLKNSKLTFLIKVWT